MSSSLKKKILNGTKITSLEDIAEILQNTAREINNITEFNLTVIISFNPKKKQVSLGISGDKDKFAGDDLDIINRILLPGIIDVGGFLSEKYKADSNNTKDFSKN
jgi:hypothetical protein